MISLTRRDVLAHQAAVPWPSQRQVEQDLLLCQTMVALFEDSFLQSQILDIAFNRLKVDFYLEVLIIPTAFEEGRQKLFDDSPLQYSGL